MATRAIDMGNGVKGVRLENLPPEAWTVVGGQAEPSELGDIYKLLGVMYRAANLVADGVASMPFDLEAGGEVVWQNGAALPAGLEWLSGLGGLLKRATLALLLSGRAYWAYERNLTGTQRSLRYMLPSSLREKWSEGGELAGFERKLKAETRQLEPEEVVYFWLPDWAVETGPAQNYPGKAALAAGGVLRNADKFLADYFERGLVKATLLTYRDSMSPTDQKLLKSWWQRVMRGLKNAFSAHVVRGDIVPVQIGEGLSELENSELTQAKQYEVALAFGVPPSKLFANAANYATAELDAVSFVADTLTPLAEFVAGVLNEQVFEELGLRWQFRPDRLEAMQRAELQKAQALVALTGKPVLTVNEARERLELPPLAGGDGEPLVEPEPAPDAAVMEPSQDERRAVELGRLRAFVRNGKHYEREFKSDILTRAEIAGVITQLATEAGDEVGHDFLWRSYP